MCTDFIGAQILGVEFVKTVSRILSRCVIPSSTVMINWKIVSANDQINISLKWIYCPLFTKRSFFFFKSVCMCKNVTPKVIF